MEYEPGSILVTGGHGFIASHVIDALLDAFPPPLTVVSLDANVHGSNPKNCSNARKSGRFTFVRGRIEDRDVVARVLRDFDVDTILHFAAESHVDISFHDPMTFTRSNVVGTQVLLEAARASVGTDCPIRRFLHVSTDEVYGEGVPDGPSVEDATLMRPTNPYAASKAAAEVLARTYHRAFGVPVVTTRGNNVYGPRQFPDKAVPKFALQAAAGRSITVHGSGSSTRSFMHASDAASAFVTVLRRAQVGTVINLAAAEEDEMSVLQLAHTVADIVSDLSGRPRVGVTHTTDRAHNDSRYWLDGGRLRDLGWSPRVRLADGLRETVAWHVLHAAQYWPAGVVARCTQSVFARHIGADVPATPSATGVGALSRATAHPRESHLDKDPDVPRDRAAAATEATSAQSAHGPSDLGDYGFARRFADSGFGGPRALPCAGTDGAGGAGGAAPIVLVYGATGWVGSKVIALLGERGVSVVRGLARLQRTPDVDAELDRVRPTHVVNCAGLQGKPNADWCEEHRRQVLAVNVHGVVQLAHACAERHVHFTTLTTACVYEYDDAHPPDGPGFSEADPPNFSKSYFARSRVACEALSAFLPGVLTVRMRMPVPEDVLHPHSLVYKLLQHDRVIETPNSVSVLPELLPLVVDMALAKYAGIYNACNPVPVTHSDILAAYRDAVDPSLSWRTMPLSELLQHVRVPRSNCVLDTTKIMRAADELGYVVRPAPEAIARVFHLFAKRRRGGETNQPRAKL